MSFYLYEKPKLGERQRAMERIVTCHKNESTQRYHVPEQTTVAQVSKQANWEKATHVFTV